MRIHGFKTPFSIPADVFCALQQYSDFQVCFQCDMMQFFSSKMNLISRLTSVQLNRFSTRTHSIHPVLLNKIEYFASPELLFFLGN